MEFERTRERKNHRQKEKSWSTGSTTTRSTRVTQQARLQRSSERTAITEGRRRPSEKTKRESNPPTSLSPVLCCMGRRSPLRFVCAPMREIRGKRVGTRGMRPRATLLFILVGYGSPRQRREAIFLLLPSSQEDSRFKILVVVGECQRCQY